MITANYNDYADGGSHKDFEISIVGEQTVIDNSKMLSESIKLQEALCSEQNLRFGACEASQFTVQVANTAGNFKGKTLEVTVTMDEATTKYGTFKVQSDKPTADRIWRVLTAYDTMYDIINADVLEWYSSLTFPMTLANFRNSFFTYLGVTQKSTTLINDSFVIQGGFTATGALSGKTIINAICEFNGVFGHINRDGEFEYISLDGADSFNCPPYENNSVTYEDYVTEAITKVTMKGSADDVGTSVGTDGNEYVIINNPLIYGTEGTQALITALTNLLNKISLVTYRPYSLNKTIGNPCVELGDAIVISTKYQTINSYVIKRVLSGIQALRDNYSATGDKTYPKEVNTIQSQINRIAGKTSELSYTVDGLQSTVTSVEQTANTALTRANGSITTDTLHYLATPLSSGVTTETAGWTTTPQSMTPTNKYLWTYHTYTYADAHTSDTTPVITGVYGEDGQQGQPGTSVTITSQSVTYQTSDSGTVTPTGTWSTSVPSVAQGQYLWTRTIVNYSNGTSTTSYSVSYQGQNGQGVNVSSVTYKYAVSDNKKTLNDYLVSFNDGADAPLDKCVAYINPVQSGSGDPSPTNIRPITGFTDADVTVNGFNQWDEEWEVGEINRYTGENKDGSVTIRSKNYIKVLPNTNYFLKSPAPFANGFFYYDENKNFISMTYSYGANQLITTLSNAYYVRFVLTSTYGITYNNDICINISDTTKNGTYEAYNGHTYNISWQTQAGTVYSGNVDLITGILTVDMASVDLGSLDWIYDAGTYGDIDYSVFAVRGFNQAKYQGKGICQQYSLQQTATYLNLQDKHFSFTNSQNYVILRIKDTSYTDAQTFKTAMNGVQLVYELATPLTYQLTPQQINSLLGSNNIWNDTNGRTEVKYLMKDMVVPESGWVDSLPDVPQGSYLWTNTKTTYTDGNISNTYTFSKQGDGVVEVTSIYYASDSSTLPSAPTEMVTSTSTSSYNTWTKGVPALTSTYNKLYTCDQVKYSNNTFTWTTPVLQNAITKAVSEIQQLANQIVLKVDENGNIVKVELSANPTTGTNFKVTADNISFIANGVIDLTADALAVKTTNFNMDQSGNITLNNGGILYIDAANGMNDTGIIVTGGGTSVNYTSMNINGFVAHNGLNVDQDIYECVINYTPVLDRYGNPTGSYHSTLVLSYYDTHLIPDEGEEEVDNYNSLTLTETGIELKIGDINYPSTQRTLFSVSSTGQIKSNSLTASKILVSDANKNIVSSSYEFDVSTNNTSDTWLLVMNNGKIQHRVSTDLSVASATTLAGQNSNLTYSTPAQWGTWSGNGFRTAWYDTANKISNQPAQYGFLLHVGRNYGEGHQIWATQANGDLYHRGFNAGSTLSSVAFKKILDSSNGVQSYADNTFYRVTALITFKSSNNALVAGDKGNYIWGISSWSDSRLKDNVKDSRVNALDIINNIKMREFDFKDKKYGNHEDIGYVAQELKEVIPECVVDIPISEEEQKEYKTDTLMQVEDKHLIKYLVKAVQELSAEVERLKNK